MSVELVTGYSGVGSDGEPNRHVSSAEDGARQAGTVGLGCYALSTGSKLSATMEDANTLVVADGDVVMNGRHVSLPDATSFTVPTGVQGQKVSNIAVLRYEKAADSVESVTPFVLTGEPSADAPADPEHNDGSILDGDSPVDMPLYRVVTDGISAGDPEPLFDIMLPMAELSAEIDELRDSVSQAVDVKQSQTWNDIVVSARECAGIVTVTVERWNKSGTATIFATPSVAGHVKAGHRPSRSYRQLLGAKADGSWLYMEVDTEGAVKVGSLYAPGDSSTWGIFSGSLSYPVGQLSVSQQPRVIIGTGIWTASAASDRLTLWTRSQFMEKFGVPFNNSYDCFTVMNGDAAAQGNARVFGCWYESGTIGCNLSGHATGAIRINYAIFLH